MRNSVHFKNKKALWIEFILLLAGLVSFFYWGNKKQPWFCDEIYTFESANGFEQAWPASCVDKWMTGADVEAFFAADWDTLSLNEITVRLYSDHVPLYFWLFRIVSFFFFRGSGSIWIGLSMNLVFYLIILKLGYRIFLYLTDAPLISGVVMVLTAVTNRLMLEQITTLRMYAMLLLAQLLLVLAGLWILHDAGGTKMKPRVFVFLFMVSVAGFLTHYDYWVFYAVTAVLICGWLLISAVRSEWAGGQNKFWVTRQFRYIIAWLGNFGASLIVTILLFPYCRWNLNRGKGQMALRSILVFSSEKIENILWGYERLAASIFGETFSEIGALLILFGCIAVGGGILYKKKEKQKMLGVIVLVLIAQAYQFCVCFTLPDAQEERYLWGSFTIMMFCMAFGGILILQELLLKIRNIDIRRKAGSLTSVVLAIGILVGELKIIDGGNGIAYLFHPNKDVSLLEEYSEVPWIVYGPTVGVYSYYDWIIPEQICFLSQDNSAEDIVAFRGVVDTEGFILYIYEDYLPYALDFFAKATGKSYTSRYLTKSTNLTVYLIEVQCIE